MKRPFETISFKTNYELAKKRVAELQKYRIENPEIEELMGDPGYQYHLFIKPYEINFAHPA
ncbi:MAG: hypothetical protein ACUVQ3_02285 [bacterium]